MNDDATVAELKAENDTLRNLLVERSKSLYDALSVLSGMWNQYCPPPWTHMHMNAGEEAKKILVKWQLLRADATSIQVSGLQVDDDVPEVVLTLIVNPVPSRQ